MAGTGKEIKNRIHSVESTRQITNAMQLVSSSKLRRAREKADSFKGYFEAVHETLMSIAKSARGSSIFFKDNGSTKNLFIIIAGERGLAGGYNTNIFKLSHGYMDQADDVIAIGKKSIEYYTKKEYKIINSFASVEGIKYEELSEISESIIDLYNKKEIGKVYLIYTEFVSALSQVPKIKRLLPLEVEADEESKEKKAVALVEYLPSKESVMGYLMPKYLTAMIYGGVTQSFASEQGARRTAMESATDNADEMLSNLELAYNRARQASVTQEITEIVGGVEALK